MVVDLVHHIHVHQFHAGKFFSVLFTYPCSILVLEVVHDRNQILLAMAKEMAQVELAVIVVELVDLDHQQNNNLNLNRTSDEVG